MADNPTHVKDRGEAYPAEATRNGTYFTPRVDIFETDGELLLFADLPGVDPGQIDLRYERGELTLRAKVVPRERRGHLLLAEYEEGDYYRVFRVSETIDPSRIEAEYTQGVLVVHLPTQDQARPRQVNVRAQ